MCKHTQHLVREVSYICKCMQNQNSHFTSSFCILSDELCNLQGEIYFISLQYLKSTSASCFLLLWERTADKSQNCSTQELKQERITTLHPYDTSYSIRVLT